MGSTVSPVFDTAPIDDVVPFLFTEGQAATLPVARVILLTTANLTQEDNILLPSKAEGVEIGMEMTIIRQDMGDYLTQWQVAILPQPGDSMAGTAWAANVAQWRLTIAGESVTFRALDGGSGTINWHPVWSDSKATILLAIAGIAASGSGIVEAAIPGGIGSVRNLSVVAGPGAGAGVTTGTLTITTTGSFGGNASGTIPTTVLGPATDDAINATSYPPYVGDVEGALGVRWATDPTYVGPVTALVTVVLW